jgi:hypothetical protein
VEGRLRRWQVWYACRMDRRMVSRLIKASVVIAGLIALPALFMSRRGSRHRSPAAASLAVRPRPKVEPAPPPKRRGRRTWLVLVLVNALAVGGSVSLALSAFGLLRQPGVPLASGYASLLVPGNPYAPADQFRLDLVMDQPGSTYVEYHVTAGCGTRARHVLLVLSGDTHLADPRYASPAGAVIGQRTAELSRPWFPVPVHAEVFDIPIRGMPCTRGVSPGQIGSEVSIGGWIQRPFEVSANSAHALQLPVIGDEVSADAYTPSLHGYWAAPIGLTADAYAGALPLYDRIDIARPGLTGSGGLTWSAHSYIIPSATWTDESASSRNQLWILLIGAMIGIIGAIPATTVLDTIRTKTSKRNYRQMAGKTGP